MGPQHTPAHGALQPFPIMLKPELLPANSCSRVILAPRLVQPLHDVAQRGQIRIEFHVRKRPHRRDRQRGGPPALTPGEQQPRPVHPHRMALAEGGQLGTVSSGLRPQFRRTEGKPVFVQDRQPVAAGGKHPPCLASGLGPQRLTQPATGTGQGGAAPPALRCHEEMAVGVITPAQIQRHPPGQQVRGGHAGRTDQLQADG